jgi:ABC-type antimicrobial peptide transport system permease subunit
MTSNTGIYIALLIMSLTGLCRPRPAAALSPEEHYERLYPFLPVLRSLVTLAVMTFPAILTATGSVWSGLAALVVAVIAALISGDPVYGRHRCLRSGIP